MQGLIRAAINQTSGTTRLLRWATTLDTSCQCHLKRNSLRTSLSTYSQSRVTKTPIPAQIRLTEQACWLRKARMKCNSTMESPSPLSSKLELCESSWRLHSYETVFLFSDSKRENLSRLIASELNSWFQGPTASSTTSYKNMLQPCLKCKKLKTFTSEKTSKSILFHLVDRTPWATIWLQKIPFTARTSSNSLVTWTLYTVSRLWLEDTFLMLLTRKVYRRGKSAIRFSRHTSVKLIAPSISKSSRPRSSTRRLTPS